MDNNFSKPKLETTVENENPVVFLIGERSALFLALSEILQTNGLSVNSFEEPTYIFQLGEFIKTDDLLKKARAKKTKFFLVLYEKNNSPASRKAEEKTLNFINSQKGAAKIIKIQGFLGEELEAAKKILKAAFGQDSQTTFVINGPGLFLEKEKTGQKNLSPKDLFKKTIIFSALIFLLTFPFSFTLINGLLGALALVRARETTLTSNFENGQQKTQKAYHYFLSAQSGLETIAPLFRFVGKEEWVSSVENYLSAGQNLSLAVRRLITIGQEGQNLALIVLGRKEGGVKEKLDKINNDLRLAEEELALLSAKNNQPRFFKREFQQIEKIRQSLIKAKAVFTALPWVLGTEEKRTYLVLFQNNMELRPSGGFIGTIGLLTFAEGKLDLKIEDVYIADGQLKGHVEPPSPLRTYLNQIHWYLRDSNWEPDFPTNARQAAWFLEKELSIKPDGVIALDLSLVKKIIEITGPIYLADYQEKITSDNLFLKAQIYSQENFFPGSTQKRDFLGTLARALFDKLASERKINWLNLVRLLEEATKEKHLLVFLNHDLIQKVISEQGWGGEIKNIKNKNENIKNIDDYLMVVEANLGVNKVNYFLKREIKKDVKFKENELSSKIIISYENNSPANVFFGGAYKNYLRILLPQPTNLEKIVVAGQRLDLVKDIDQSVAFEKKIIGFLLEVPAGGKKLVEIDYSLPVVLAENEFIYQLLIQKQAGTENDKLEFNLSSPWLITGKNFPDESGDNRLVKSGNLSYNGNLSVDQLFQIEIRKE